MKRHFWFSGRFAICLLALTALLMVTSCAKQEPSMVNSAPSPSVETEAGAPPNIETASTALAADEVENKTPASPTNEPETGESRSRLAEDNNAGNDPPEATESGGLFSEANATPAEPLDSLAATSPAGDPQTADDEVYTPTTTAEQAPVQSVRPTPAHTAAPTPAPVTVNGLSIDEFVIMPPLVKSNVQAIYQRGQEIGRNPYAFSKLGSSTIATPQYLTWFERGVYDLGDYDYLREMIAFFDGSFERYGVGVKEGLTAWAIFDPEWLDLEWCQPEEAMVACEIRLHNPSIILIVVGSNDIAEAEVYEDNMRQTVEIAIEAGVIPILTTKADRYEGSNRNNNILYQIAADYLVPILDFDRISSTMPGKGLSGDGVHMTYYDVYDYTDPVAFQRGYGMLNLTTLIALDKVWREMLASEEKVFEPKNIIEE